MAPLVILRLFQSQGDQVTNDIAVALRTPTKNAEQIKIKYGTVLSHKVDPTESIEVPSVADRPPKEIHRRALAQVIEARYQELFALVLAELRRSGYEELVAAGMVITGGAANIDGIVDLAESIFQMPVRIGVPSNVFGLMDVRDNPSYATGVGLLMHGLQRQSQPDISQFNTSTKGVWKRMRDWFNGNF